jgi:hypothetical protein
MWKRTLAGYEKALGPDHSDTLTSVGNLGVLCCDRSRFDEAEAVLKRALMRREKALGAGPSRNDSHCSESRHTLLQPGQARRGKGYVKARSGEI